MGSGKVYYNLYYLAVEYNKLFDIEPHDCKDLCTGISISGPFSLRLSELNLNSYIIRPT